ncbi:MAG: hypothetical protein AAF770_02435 [Bacteroidota bacterium]
MVYAFHGTSEEIYLIRFLQGTLVNLEKKYDEVYFMRNEEQYTIYDFEQVRGLQHDFFLFLKEEGAQEISY